MYNVNVRYEGRDRRGSRVYKIKYLQSRRKRSKMANYKKLETLVKNFAETTDEMYEEIIDNEMVDVSTLSDKKKFAVLVFTELAKALDTKEHKLLLDCNFPASKFHNHADEAEDEYKVDYYRLVSSADANRSLIQVYVNADPKTGTAKFRLCTSCAKANREQFEALEDELHFLIQRDSNTGRAKTSTRDGITYDEIVDVVKAVCAVLANTRAQSAAAKEEKKKAKAKKETTEEEETTEE